MRDWPPGEHLKLIKLNSHGNLPQLQSPWFIGEAVEPERAPENALIRCVHGNINAVRPD